MRKLKILVTGAGGMVGSYVPHVFSDAELILTDIVEDFTHLDVRNPDDVRYVVKDVSPDIVLHLAAATDVDRCQNEVDWAYHTNSIGSQSVAIACLENNCEMVYIGTAGVFSGDKRGPYTEFDEPNPANIYGKTKLAGENLVVSLLGKYYIVRAGWMIGGGKKDKKFVGMIIKKIINGEKHLFTVNDKYGSSTYAKDLLFGIKRLINTKYYGLFHLVNTGVASRYEVALEIIKIMGRSDIVVEPVSSSHFPLPAPRARSEAMSNYKLNLMGLNGMRHWQDALNEYIIDDLLPALGSSN